MERFLQQCAKLNLQVINATTPAQQFHAIRRQIKRDFRKPLVCFTPKKLLRYPSCVSALKDFTKGGFKEIIDDDSVDAKKVKRIAFCSGKIFYDLIERRNKEGHNDIAFVRVEQLYPFPQKQFDEIIKKYKSASEYLWVQEEPENAGPWRHVAHTLKNHSLRYIGREEAASPATGFSKRHNEELEEIMEKIFVKVTVK
jgi:2-oxoglutarate dehydrogenase E1 component